MSAERARCSANDANIIAREMHCGYLGARSVRQVTDKKQPCKTTVDQQARFCRARFWSFAQILDAECALYSARFRSCPCLALTKLGA
jgi:hypothetical protein